MDELTSVVEVEESQIIEIVSRSAYLTLLRDKSLYHLRLKSGVDPIKLLNDKIIGKELISNYPSMFDEKLTYERNGDINRFIVTEGKKVKMKIEICVINDPKNGLGKGYKDPEGVYIPTHYSVNGDSILGDQVYDPLVELVGINKVNSVSKKYHENEGAAEIARKLEVSGLNYVEFNEGNANSLREFCCELFYEFFEDNFEFSIVYFNSLKDAEQDTNSRTL